MDKAEKVFEKIAISAELIENAVKARKETIGTLQTAIGKTNLAVHSKNQLGNMIKGLEKSKQGLSNAVQETNGQLAYNTNLHTRDIVKLDKDLRANLDEHHRQTDLIEHLKNIKAGF